MVVAVLRPRTEHSDERFQHQTHTTEDSIALGVSADSGRPKTLQVHLSHARPSSTGRSRRGDGLTVSRRK